MAKKVNGYVKLQVPAGSANPSPPIGPALGQQGVNIMEFCKQFNAATQKLEKGLPIPVVITVYADRSFTFIMKTPPAAVLIRKAIGIEIEGLEGGSFVAPQFQALSRLLRAVVSRYPIVEIVGHEHVAPGRKRDPGPGFDWMRLRRRLHASRALVWPFPGDTA